MDAQLIFDMADFETDKDKKQQLQVVQSDVEVQVQIVDKRVRVQVCEEPPVIT